MDEKQLKTLKLMGYSIEELPSKTIPRMTYYKSDGEVLIGLADPYHLKRYLSRGLTLEPPKTEPQEVIPETGGEEPVKEVRRGRPKSHKKEK